MKIAVKILLLICCLPNAWAASGEAAPMRPPEVVLLSASWCGPCTLLKNEMAKKGVTNKLRLELPKEKACNLEFKIADVSTEAYWNEVEARYGKFVGVPAVQVRSLKPLFVKTFRLDQSGKDPDLALLTKTLAESGLFKAKGEGCVLR